MWISCLPANTPTPPWRKRPALSTNASIITWWAFSKSSTEYGLKVWYKLYVLMAFRTSCISRIGATMCLPSIISVIWLSDNVFPSIASEPWIVFIRLIFRNNRESSCSIRIAYRSTCADILAMRWIAWEDIVKGGVYMAKI